MAWGSSIGRVPPFVSIAASRLDCGKAVLFALDFDGRAWQRVEDDTWRRVPPHTPDNPPEGGN